MTTFDPTTFGPGWVEILGHDRCRPLDAGSPQDGLRRQLQSATLEQRFGQQPIRDRQMAELCLAGAWLLADDLDASHAISQQIETASGSYWHAIMHRREGDFSNAKYWFRRVGEHPVYPAVLQSAQTLAEQVAPGDHREKFLALRRWDAFHFVDWLAAQSARRSVETEESQILRRIAQAEWELLFAHCHREALA